MTDRIGARTARRSVLAALAGALPGCSTGDDAEPSTPTASTEPTPTSGPTT